jgi:broad specificity phosphatase PhoE
VELDFIFSSPFLRCVQTADAVAAAQEQERRRRARQQQSVSVEADDVVVPIFIEHALGEWDDGKRISPRTTAELKALFPRVDDEAYTSVVLPHQVDDDADETYRGESVRELHERCERFVEFVNQHEVYGAEGKHILFVGHAASAIAFYRAWMQDRTADFFPATCSLSKLVQLHDDDAGEVDVVIRDKDSSAESSSPSRRPQNPIRWKTELWGDCSHLSSGQQRPWRFSESHDQSLALAAASYH